MSRSPYHAEQPPPLHAPAGVAVAVGWTVAARFWRAHHPHPLFPRQCTACGMAVPCRMWTFADGLLREALDELAADGQARAYDGGARSTNAVGGEQPNFYAVPEDGLNAALSDAPTQVLPVVGHGRGKASVPVLVPPMRGERRRPGPLPGMGLPATHGETAAEAASETETARIFPALDELATGERKSPAGSARRQRAQRRVLEVFPPEPVEPQAKGGTGEQRQSERQQQQQRAGERHNLPAGRDPRRKA